MGKQPSYQWYTGDWRKDTQIQMSSMTTRGVWREMLDCMWDAPERGKLTGTDIQIQKLLGCTENEWEIFLHEFSMLKIGDLTENGDGVLTFINRRMLRQEQERIDHLNRQLKYLEKKRSTYKDTKVDTKLTEPCDIKLTLPSSSSSSSSSSNKEKKYIKKSKIPDEEWLQELQKKECYSYLNIKEQLEKCITYFEVKGITVSKQRFLNWINNPKFNPKPLSLPKEKEESKPAMAQCKWCKEIYPVNKDHQCKED